MIDCNERTLEMENMRYAEHLEAIAWMRRARARNTGYSSRKLRAWVDGRIKTHETMMAEKV
jgi:hypothetical protein